jgi:ATP synthase protein I
MRRARRLVLGQFVGAGLIGALLGLVGPVHGYSGLMGGFIAAVSNGFFASRVFGDYRAQEPHRMLQRWYGAEVSRLVLVGLLFAAAFIWVKPLSVGALLGAFLVIHLIPSVLAAAG